MHHDVWPDTSTHCVGVKVQNKPSPIPLMPQGNTIVRAPCRLRDDARKDKAVLGHLEAENAYTRAVLADTEALQVS